MQKDAHVAAAIAALGHLENGSRLRLLGFLAVLYPVQFLDALHTMREVHARRVDGAPPSRPQ